MSKRMVLLVLVTLLSLVVGFVTFTPAQAVGLVRHGGYWLVLLGFVLFAWYFARSLRAEGASLAVSPGWGKAALFVLGMAVFLHLHERHEFKIVADEVVLGSTAMEMHFERQAAVVVRGYDYAGNFTPLNVYVDKRPLLFPFLVSLVHDLSGYRVTNVFALNALLSLALTTLFFLLGRRLGGPPAGVAAVLLVCAVPLVAQNATGGGFELLNMVMIVLSMWLGLRYAERPTTDRLCAFVLSGVLLAQVRYESAVFVLPVGATIAYVWWREHRVDLPWPVILTPFLLLLLPLQHNVFNLSQASWQLNDVAGATQPFGPQYFYDNVGHALNFFFSFDGTQPSSWLVALLGVVGVGFFVLTLYKHHQEIFALEPAMAAFCIFIIGLLVHTGLMLCYFWGRWDDPIIRRLSLPAHILLILAFVFVVPRLIGHRLRWSILIGIVLAYLVSVTVPVSAMHRYTEENFAARTTNWLGGRIRALGAKSVLAIDNNAGLQWFLYRKSSINPTALSLRPEAFLYHYRRHSFDEIIVVQRVGLDLAPNQRFVSAEDDLGPGIQLETIEEKAFAPPYLVRMSRVIGVDEPKLLAWAKERKKLAEAKKITSIAASVDADQLVDWLRQLP
ncbi:MAG TPA: glycosyltransferase family 39 protein [Opitutaceae bacterium]|nr:glycosyltransferase family 39 protein [Opitutaceae bacterium]